MATSGGVGGIVKRARDLGPVLSACGNYFVKKTKAAFREQGRAGHEWRPRSVPNIIGVLADLRGGGRPKDRRWDPRPAGRDTGRLEGSIAWQRVGATSIEVGSSVRYASDVQRGSTRLVATDSALAAKLRRWIQSLQGERRKRAQRSAGALARKGGGSRTVEVPPRPFLVITPQDRAQFRRYLLGWILNGNTGA